MGVTYKKDYVFSDKPNLGTEFFIGTRNYIFIYPIKATEHQGQRSITNIDYFIKGESPDVYFRALLDNPETTLESLEEELLLRAKDFEEKDLNKAKCWKISEYKYFKVQANFLGSTVLLGNKKIGFSSLIVTPLGKQYKKDIKEYYLDLVNA